MTPAPSNVPSEHAAASGWAGMRDLLRERWELVALAVLAVAPLVVPALGGALGTIAVILSLIMISAFTAAERQRDWSDGSLKHNKACYFLTAITVATSRTA